MTNNKKGIIRIGTSGIVFPGTKQTFPKEFQSKSRLYYYSTLFNTLEINSSFHKVPLPSTFQKWSAEVSDTFKFSVKLSREITHVKKLLYKVDDVDNFMQAANLLGNNKGCLLVQFPSSITFDYFNGVEKILQRIHQLNMDGRWHIVIEFRHNSWYQDITYTMVNKFNASLVFHDIAASKTPLDNPASDIVYLRFHGPNGDYRGSYSDEFLQKYADRIKAWSIKGKEVYVYFNNTMGSAFQNAQLLQQLI
jgi:uncharacterized protein YecE (DUF72 family)